MIRVCHTYNRSLSTRTTALSAHVQLLSQSVAHVHRLSLSHTVSVTQSPSHSLRHTVSVTQSPPVASLLHRVLPLSVSTWPRVYLLGRLYCVAACIAWPLVLLGRLYCLAACIAWPLPRLPSDLSLSLHDVFFCFFVVSCLPGVHDPKP